MEVDDLYVQIHNQIQDESTVGESLDDILEQYSAEICGKLFVKLIQSENFPEGIRSYAAYLCWHCPEPIVKNVLRATIHDRQQPKILRVRALGALSVLDVALLHVDLIALLSDPAEEVWMRAEAADKIGGCGLSQKLTPLLKQTLMTPELPAEIAFRCLYAISSIGEDHEIIECVSSYLEDERKVHINFGDVKWTTVSVEAEWALARLQGDNEIEPGWAQHATVNS